MLVNVGDERIAIVHGDDSSLAGWGFSQEALSTTQGLAAASAAFECTGVQVFTSSHTCLPVLRRLSEGRTVVNNGAAGMPEFFWRKIRARNANCALSMEGRFVWRAVREFVY